MVRRRILIAVLALGTVGGYAAGFASLHHHRQLARCCDHDRGDDRARRSWRDDDRPRFDRDDDVRR